MSTALTDATARYRLLYRVDLKNCIGIQWGSEIHTSLDFKWSGFRMGSEIRSPVFEIRTNCRHLFKNHLKFGQESLDFEWLGL